MQSTSDAIQAPTRGWRRLPAEMRVEIYKHMWTPTTIVISTKWPCPQKLPVTLHLNRESRGETLRSYYPYTVHFSADPFWNRLSKFGYINPHLDIVHFDSLPGRRGSGPLEVEFPGITKPLLRITIDQGNSAFDPRILDPVLPIIRSIDFWSFPEGGFPDFPDDLRRYRICRIPASTPRTPVARFEDALFVPEYPLRADQNQVSCTKPDCRSPFTYFKWRNVPSENQVITSLPPDLDHLVLDGRLTSELTPVNKYKASELRLPCAVSYWSNDKTMDALQRDKVILFDIGNGAQHTGIQQQGDEWVVLKVVSPTQVPSEEVIMGSLAYHRKVLMRGYFPEVPHWPDFSLEIETSPTGRDRSRCLRSILYV
ncbi:hypothetical protein QBC40DRAFT_346161 [Triangularia verruculosa]|uniref:2EXR domain-containing protein n=1 Tax=Triangularia verruculosa TaxID=2587418 RepID=A0AAN6XMJ3_9PEZI|nr:hypothetical protein QBC40DRAFT_346161 [Triangularia verruculosa]